jgi:hypothetical protein
VKSSRTKPPGRLAHGCTAPQLHGWLGRLGMRSFLGSVAESLGISKKKHSAPPARTPRVASPKEHARHPSPHLQVSRGMRRSSATRRRRASWRRRNNGSSSRLRRASATPLRMVGHLQMSPPPRPRPPSPCMICTRARRSWRRRPPVTAGCRASTIVMRRGAARSKTARPAATRHSLGATVARP